jgi:rhodanese-related sulfurtransferase
LKKTYVIIITLFLSLFLTACSSAQQPEELSGEEAKQMIDSEDVTVLDVRTEEEYEQGHIADSLLIPLNDLESRLHELDKNQPYLVVCRTGNRSSQAADVLRSNGFTDVYNLQSGISAWSYPLEN